MAFIKVTDSNYIDDKYFDITKKTIREISGYDTIKESIENILLTYPGEIPFDPTFGCGVIYRIFTNFNPNNANVIKDIIIDSLNYWEPRIILLRDNVTINTDIDNHTVSVSISYVIKSTGKTDTYKKIIGV